ncbi:YjbF family lipoprotein [Georgfuchsia toluolica]|uniref:YjbF family lipoprotein n=1 Tax=Georgfuchsia toluolica TaxID=424218 RepID=UPI001C73BB2F|nr:YjbF family lipoprotein [Georgfuchsia toluolica]
MIVIPLLLAACTSGTSAIVRTLELASNSGVQETAAPTTPGISYIRVLSEGHTAYLALGYVEPEPEGNTEIWYSAKGEVLRLRNGRIVGTTGLATDWREVRLPKLPPWSHIGNSPLQYQRSRDEMPDYRFDIAETVSVRAVMPPKTSQLKDRDPAGLRWFEETVTAGPQISKELPPSLYAVELAKDKELVVYGETCLTATLCLAWQRLPKGSTN